MNKKKNKFCKLILFAKILPKLRKDIIQNLMDFDYNDKKKLIYFLLAIMDKCTFRIGNDIYKNTKGLSGLSISDLKFNKNSVKIKFIGKKQVVNTCTIKNFYLNKLLFNITHRNKRSIKKFNKNDETLIFIFHRGGKQIKISASSVNRLLKNYGNVTTKYFRTWKANKEFIKYMCKIKKNEKDYIYNNKILKNNIKEAIKSAAKTLNHTKNVCKSSYMSPNLIKLYLENTNKFYKFCKESKKIQNLTKYESILINILRYFCNNL